MSGLKKDGTRKEIHADYGSSIEAFWEFQNMRCLKCGQEQGWWISNASGWLSWILFPRIPFPMFLVRDLVGREEAAAFLQVTCIVANLLAHLADHEVAATAPPSPGSSSASLTPGPAVCVCSALWQRTLIPLRSELIRTGTGFCPLYGTLAGAASLGFSWSPHFTPIFPSPFSALWILSFNIRHHDSSLVTPTMVWGQILFTNFSPSLSSYVYLCTQYVCVCLCMCVIIHIP